MPIACSNLSRRSADCAAIGSRMTAAISSMCRCNRSGKGQPASTVFFRCRRARPASARNPAARVTSAAWTESPRNKRTPDSVRPTSASYPHHDGGPRIRDILDPRFLESCCRQPASLGSIEVLHASSHQQIPQRHPRHSLDKPRSGSANRPASALG